jgi:polyhydroxyalkanoate synthase
MVRAVGGRRAIDLLGVCQGGVLALCYAALEQRKIRRLVTMVTPVAFQTADDLLSHWLRGVDVARLESASQALPGALLPPVFQALAPFRLSLAKYFDLMDHCQDPEWVEHFRRMEHWVHDSPGLPARATAEFVRSCYQEDRLRAGTLMLADRRVDLSAIRAPLLNVYALEDHIVPPDAARALSDVTNAREYDELAVPTGHIGVFVSRRAEGVPRRIASWLERR